MGHDHFRFGRVLRGGAAPSPEPTFGHGPDAADGISGQRLTTVPISLRLGLVDTSETAQHTHHEAVNRQDGIHRHMVIPVDGHGGGA